LIYLWRFIICKKSQDILNALQWLMLWDTNSYTMKVDFTWIPVWYFSIMSSTNGLAISLLWRPRELSDIDGHNLCAFSESCQNFQVYWGLSLITIRTDIRFGKEMLYRLQDLITSGGQFEEWKNMTPIIWSWTMKLSTLLHSLYQAIGILIATLSDKIYLMKMKSWWNGKGNISSKTVAYIIHIALVNKLMASEVAGKVLNGDDCELINSQSIIY
jgi:hypothetical protein